MEEIRLVGCEDRGQFVVGVKLRAEEERKTMFANPSYSFVSLDCGDVVRFACPRN